MQTMPQKIHNPFDYKTNKKQGHASPSVIFRFFNTTSKFKNIDETHRVLKDYILNL
jgi:hypothetical protein